MGITGLVERPPGERRHRCMFFFGEIDRRHSINMPLASHR
jgi:hypothetical protein